MRVALLLRGVNVGGVTVRSADLRALLADAGLGDVVTVLASGNAVVTATDAPAATEIAEAALAAHYDRRIRVLGISIDALAAVVADYPYVEDNDHTPYVVFELDAGVVAELEEFEPGDGEAITARDSDSRGVIYWSNPKGTTLTSPFAKALERTAKDRVTTRNVRTLRKVLAAA